MEPRNNQSIRALGRQLTVLRTPSRWGKQAWAESLEDYRSRLKTCAAYINETYNVEGLCRDLLTRLHDLEEAEGDRIRK